MTLETVDLGIPEGRNIPNQTVVERAAEHLDDLADMLRRKREFVVLVATDAGCPVGFLVLELGQIEETTGDRQSHIYNLAVKSNHLGRRIGHELVKEAARITHRRGCEFMTGRITASNERALLAALRLGFEVERHQIVMACGPQGPVPMPGRPADQRAHATSRLLRRRQRRRTSDARDEADHKLS